MDFKARVESADSRKRTVSVSARVRMVLAASGYLARAFFPLSSGVMNPMGRFGGPGGVIRSRNASNTCLSWARVLRLKAS